MRERERERERVQRFNKLLRVVEKKTLRVNSDELPHRTVSSSDSVPFPFLSPHFSLSQSPFAGFSTVSLRFVFRSRIDFSESESEVQLNRSCSISFPLIRGTSISSVRFVVIFYCYLLIFPRNPISWCP